MIIKKTYSPYFWLISSASLVSRCDMSESCFLSPHAGYKWFLHSFSISRMHKHVQLYLHIKNHVIKWILAYKSIFGELAITIIKWVLEENTRRRKTTFICGYVRYIGPKTIFLDVFREHYSPPLRYLPLYVCAYKRVNKRNDILSWWRF